MPALATIAGPAGPSGVMPTQSPAASALTMVRSAELPPRRVEPATDCTPKCATESAMIRPSPTSAINRRVEFVPISMIATLIGADRRIADP